MLVKTQKPQDDKEISPIVTDTLRKIKQMREELDLSQNRLADGSGYSQSHIWKLENFQDISASLDCVLKMCEVLAVQLQDVLRFHEVNYSFLHTLFLFSKLSTEMQRNMVCQWGAEGLMVTEPCFYEAYLHYNFFHWSNAEREKWIQILERYSKMQS